jgi:hypothetical protein
MKRIIKQRLKERLTSERIGTLREIYNNLNINNIYKYQIKARIYAKNLNKLATIYGSDKWGTNFNKWGTNSDKFGPHWYTKYYQKHFRHLRKKRLNVLEIGVLKGESLRMWKRYFPKSQIFGIDILDARNIEESRIKIFQGDQGDECFLEDVFKLIGSLDIIIDDGSHQNKHVICSFQTLFPLLNDGGIYVVEDLQTSYWPSFGGDSKDLNNPNTSMNFFKSLTDGLNYEEYENKEYIPNYFDKHIESIHFYHNLVFIYKSCNEN